MKKIKHLITLLLSLTVWAIVLGQTNTSAVSQTGNSHNTEVKQVGSLISSEIIQNVACNCAFVD
jgi:hypothetical protein